MLIISLLIINFLFFKSDIAGHYLFPQGDTNFYIIDLQDSHSEKIFAAHSLFITGSTYFTINDNHYLAYIVGHEQERAVFNSTFEVLNISGHSHPYHFNLPFYPYAQNGSVIYDGLTVLHLNDQFVFTTIISAGKSQSTMKTYLLQFSLNGSDFKVCKIINEQFPELVIRDISYYNESSYLIIASLYNSEDLDLGARHILISDTHGNLTQLADLKHNALQISYDNTTDTIFLSYHNKKSIEQRYLNGTLLNDYTIHNSPEVFRVINHTTILVSEYVQKFEHLIIAGLIAAFFFGVIPHYLDNSSKVKNWLNKKPQFGKKLLI